MAHPGRPRKHYSRANDIRKAIEYSTTIEAIELLEQTDPNILDGEARTPLINTVIASKQDIFTWLLSHGADINHQDRNGFTALHFAVQKKQIEFIKTLLEHGAKIDLKDQYGNTPLWRATFDARGEYELVKLLISHGSDPNSKNTAGRSPLDFAAQIKDNELIEILRKG